jgi:type I restriction enzyme M protein
LSDTGKRQLWYPQDLLPLNRDCARERLVENNWLRGVVSMPSNIFFASTGTNAAGFRQKADQSLF